MPGATGTRAAVAALTWGAFLGWHLRPVLLPASTSSSVVLRRADTVWVGGGWADRGGVGRITTMPARAPESAFTTILGKTAGAATCIDESAAGLMAHGCSHDDFQKSPNRCPRP